MPARLTRRQNQALDFIVDFSAERSCPPTIREIGEALGISSTNGVRYLLDVLVQKGYIRRRPQVSRGIELLRIPSQANLLTVPSWIVPFSLPGRSSHYGSKGRA